MPTSNERSLFHMPQMFCHFEAQLSRDRHEALNRTGVHIFKASKDSIFVMDRRLEGRNAGQQHRYAGPDGHGSSARQLSGDSCDAAARSTIHLSGMLMAGECDSLRSAHHHTKPSVTTNGDL